MKAAAMAYAEKGIAVFPLAAGKKIPAIRKEDGGRGCLDATTDTATIKAWWSKYPNANIGYATGKINDIVVIDVDTGHHNEEDGADTIRSLEKKLGPLPDTKMQLTPNGGTHYFFKYPDSFDIKHYESKRADDPKVDKYEGIDIVGIDIRGNGGYVVAQPSIITKKDGTMGKYMWEATADDTDIAELPIAWQEFIYDLEYTSPGSNASSGEPTPAPVWNGEGFDILTEVLPRINCAKCNYSQWVSVGMALKNLGYSCEEWDKWSRTDPGRYESGQCEKKWDGFRAGDGANLGARYLIDLAKAGGLKTQPPGPEVPYYIEQAEQRDRAPIEWDGIISDPGDRDPEQMQEQSQQQEQGQGQGNTLTEAASVDNYQRDSADPGPTPPPAKNQQNQQPEITLPDIIDITDALLQSPPEMKPELIDGILRKSHKMILTGPSKSGKSFALIELALALSNGVKWLGYQCHHASVLFINLEIDDASFINRISAVAKAMGVTINNAFHVWNLRGCNLPIDVLTEQTLARIKKSQGYDAIIIDPIYKLLSGSENDAGDTAAMLRHFDRMCKEAGASVIYCHHHSKGTQGQKNALDRASGSGVYGRDADASVDFCPLSIPEGAMGPAPKASPLQVDFTLREFERPDPVKLWFAYPLHTTYDPDGWLLGAELQGSSRANLRNSSKFSTSDTRRNDLENAFKKLDDGSGMVSVKAIAKKTGKTEKTVKNWVKEFDEEYTVSNGIVTRS